MAQRKDFTVNATPIHGIADLCELHIHGVGSTYTLYPGTAQYPVRDELHKREIVDRDAARVTIQWPHTGGPK